MAGEESHLLTIRLRPSPILLASILAAHVAAGGVLLCMDLPFAPAALFEAMVVLSAVLAARAHARKRGVALILAADGALRIDHEGDGDDSAWGRVLPGAVVFPAVSWFALGWTTADGRKRRLYLMLIAAEVEEPDGGNSQWRRLRTWLRHRALRPLTAADDA
ncbi:MAG: hypothetical protein LBF91_02755 [Azoarcus sp.]|jgi:hypothetical protein|nr:hypothetical protein [Azoarcus sp.]